jgi:hypothetical protein
MVAGRWNGINPTHVHGRSRQRRRITFLDLPAQDTLFENVEKWFRPGASVKIDGYVLMYILVDTSEAIYE